MTHCIISSQYVVCPPQERERGAMRRFLAVLLIAHGAVFGVSDAWAQQDQGSGPEMGGDDRTLELPPEDPFPETFEDQLGREISEDLVDPETLRMIDQLD